MPFKGDGTVQFSKIIFFITILTILHTKTLRSDWGTNRFLGFAIFCKIHLELLTPAVKFEALKQIFKMHMGHTALSKKT